jgi:dsRNA-specific ribonuclease
MMAETFEALIGAVNLDGGVEAAQRVIKHLGFLEDPLLKP